MIHIRKIFLLFLIGQIVWAQTDPSQLDIVFDKALSYHYVNKDSAYYFYEKTIELADQQDNLDYLLGGLGYLINANNNFYDLEGFGQNILRMNKLLYQDPRINGFHAEKYYKERLLYDKGNYYYKLKEYATAQKYILELYGKIKSKPEINLDVLDIETMSGIYSFLGLIYRHTGKYEQAEFYYKKDIDWVTKYKDSLDDWQSASFNSKKLLSQVYEIQNKSEGANALLKEALNFYRSKSDNPRYRNNFLTTYILLAKNYFQQGKYDEAISVLNDNKPNTFKDIQFEKEIDVLYGDIFLAKKNFQEANNFYYKALAAYNEYRHQRPHQDIAEVYGKIAKSHLNREDYIEGINVLKAAFNNSGSSIELSDNKSPDPNEVFSKKQLLELLDLKLQLLQTAYFKTKDDDFLARAVLTNKAILKTFDLLKKEFDSKLDKQFLAEKAYPIFHRMLNVTFEFYQKNPSKELFELALNISEKNKDFLLLEALRNAQATQFGNVPKEVLEKESQLRAEITNVEKELFDTNEAENGFSEDLFKLKQEYYVFLDTIESKYPKYHELKYQNTTLSLETVRKKVVDDGILISYTMTDDNLYAIVISSSKQDFLKLPFNEIDRESIREFYRSLSNPSINWSEKEIGALAEKLHEKILKRPLVDFHSENLTIVPDGELYYLTFDLLQENGTALLETKNIGYGNSVTSLLELKEKIGAKSNKMLAFAPSFSGTVTSDSDRQFGKLMYNDDEVLKIGSFYENETLLKNEASLANFKASTSGFNIFHLATHASANDEYPDYSYLAFTKTKDSIQDNILYIKDLYNITLNADMVTLSACQTGIGKLQKGQGMMSLSKGFYYAGAKSLVNTLWKINDKSTVTLMEYFYEGLSQGESKTEALRNAKLRYLETTADDLLKHPYYWAAFMVSGDTMPLTPNTNLWWMLGLAVIAILASGLYFKSYKSKK